MEDNEYMEKDFMNKENTDSESHQETHDGDEVSNESSEVKEQSAVLPEEKLNAEISDLKDKYLRLYSEFENYRKRTSKERLDLIKTASEDIIKDIIPVLDDFERALKASESEGDIDIAKILDGNQLIFKKLEKILESNGLKAMEDQVGKQFDPDKQEAIVQIEAPSKELKGKVIEVVEKGYTLGEKVVRYAKVVIGA
jgi:molecular chaperone GrpE